MMSRFIRKIRSLAAVFCTCALALPGAALGLTFDDALRLAQQQAPSLRAEASRLQAARSEASAAGELPDPKLLLGLQSVPIEGAERWSLNDDAMTMRMVGLMQEVPNRDKRKARTEVARAAIDRAAAEQEVEALKVRLAAAQAWIATHAVERKIRLFDELLEENRILDEAVRARIAGGRGQLTDSVVPRQEAASLAERQDELEQLRRQARAALVRWVGEAGSQPLDGDLPHWPLIRDRLPSQMHNHPQLLAYAPLTRQAQARIREASAEKQPDWSWEVSYLNRGRAFGDMLNLQFSFDLPVFQRSRQNPRIAARHAELDQLEAEREAANREVAERLAVELAEFERLQRARVRSAEVQLPLAREKAELAMAGYRAGTIDLDAVLAARNELIETRLKHIDLQGLEAIANARLYLAYGETK
ncbi:TolC family protein [Pseudomonas lopnurensis]|uniref:TolC family protein n=1 Tax=Pseudomonas lopnurensis TaxID=1477517 RepID=UPI001879E84B|nr:TolC family protein [Pseudomonas lopnurensis]MBE7377152.1 TolC family protein [Pseudomonas lopnurensis]